MADNDLTHDPTHLRIPDPGVRECFALARRWQAWLDVEVALAKAEATLGMIPAAAAVEIERKAKVELLDQARVLEGLQRTAHPLVPLVWELSEICEGDAGGYVHWGATTQNITQTGEVMLLREVHRIFLGQLARVLAAMAPLARRTRDFALPGRTHGQHAVPATFGYKVAVWIDELLRHLERLQGLEDRVFTCMLGGAAGTFASFGAQGFEVQRLAAGHLGLRPMSIPSRAIGDHYGEYVCVLGLLAATCRKFGAEVYELMKDEFGEVEEPVPAGTVGSSTMPQKRNPKLAQDIVTAIAQIRGLVPVALEAMQTEHEADRAMDTLMKNTLEQVCVLTADVLERVRVVTEGLSVNRERMRRNLDLSGGMILSEALMLSLGESVGRQEAHDIIYDIAQAVATDGGSFAERLKRDLAVTAKMSPEAIEAMLDPGAYTGLCAEMADEAADRAEAAVKALATG